LGVVSFDGQEKNKEKKIEKDNKEKKINSN